MSEQLTKLQTLLLKLERWETFIEEALAYGGHTHSFDDVVGMVLQGKVLFFSYEKCFVVMEKVDYPQLSTFHCFLAGGEMDAIIATQDEMERIGRDLGCKYLSIAGRKGWQRRLADLGWEHLCTTMLRPIGELQDEQQGWAADLDCQTARRDNGGGQGQLGAS